MLTPVTLFSEAPAFQYINFLYKRNLEVVLVECFNKLFGMMVDLLESCTIADDTEMAWTILFRHPDTYLCGLVLLLLYVV